MGQFKNCWPCRYEVSVFKSLEPIGIVLYLLRRDGKQRQENLQKLVGPLTWYIQRQTENLAMGKVWGTWPLTSTPKPCTLLFKSTLKKKRIKRMKGRQPLANLWSVRCSLRCPSDRETRSSCLGTEGEELQIELPKADFKFLGGFACRTWFDSPAL